MKSSFKSCRLLMGVLICFYCPSGLSEVRSGFQDSVGVAQEGRPAEPNKGRKKEEQTALLEQGKPIEGVLEGGQTHSFDIRLIAGQLLHAAVDQRGIDVVVTIFSPDNQQVFQVDSPNGDTGPEPVWFVAGATGTYRLEISALDKSAHSGRYEARILEIRIATTDDKALGESNDLEQQADKLFNERRYDEAISLAERVLAVREKLSVPRYPFVAEPLTNLANDYDSKGDFTHAIQYATRALAIVEQELGPDNSEVADRLNNLGLLYQSKRDYVHAEIQLRRALAISEKTGARADTVVFRLNNLALLLLDKGDYASASPLFDRALPMLEAFAGRDHRQVATLLGNSSKLYRAIGDYSRAESTLLRAIEIIRGKGLGEDPQVATFLNGLAEVYRQRGEYTKAEPLYQHARKIFEAKLGANRYETANVLNDLAALYAEQSDYGRAEELYLQAIAIYQKDLGGGHSFVATGLRNLATLYDYKGDYASAEITFRQALQIREGAIGPEPQEDAAYDLNNFAQFYFKQGNYIQAESLYQRALTILEKVLGEEHPTVATVLNNLGSLYEKRGDLTRAEDLYHRALRIREKTLGTEHPDVAISLNNIALVYMNHGDTARAEPLLQRVMKIWEISLGTEHPNYASSLNNMAAVYEKKGDVVRAEATYQRALAIREKALGAEHPDVADTLNNLALLYRARRDYVRAEQFQQRALAIYENSFGDAHPAVATLLSNLAEIYRAKGDSPQAVLMQTRANEISEHHLALLMTAGSEEQKRLYASTLSEETDYTLSLHTYNLPNSANAARLALTTLLRRKGRVLDATSDQIGALRRHLSTQDQTLLEHLSAARAQLAALILKGPGKNPPAVHQATVVKQRSEVDRLEAEASNRSAVFPAQSRSITVESIQSVIPDLAALVEIALYRPYKVKPTTSTDRRDQPRYVAYVLFNKGAPKWVDLGESADINAEVTRFRLALSDPQHNDVKEIARTLDEKVMRPLRKLLGGSRQIFLSPDGALNLVPFAALVDEQSRYLVENYAITYLTSGRDLLRFQLNPESNKQEPIIIANPLFDILATAKSGDSVTRQTSSGRRSVDMSQLKFGLLPGTDGEAKAIGQVFPQAKILTQADATEGALKQVRSPSILHIATHGFFLSNESNNPASSLSGALQDGAPATLRNESPLLRFGLALAGANSRSDGTGNDGILTALEASGLDLLGTKLVVLSACETGIGEVKNGDGVYGLRRALVLAGAESEVMSLWKVSDAATRDFMEAYYQRLKAGEGRTEALRHVQLDTIKKGLRIHPFFWAAFIQSGDWRSLNNK